MEAVKSPLPDVLKRFMIKKKKKLPKKHYLSHLETIEIVLSYTIQQNVCNLYRANQEIYTVGLFE